MRRFTSKTQSVGQIGEKIAAEYLSAHGYSIVEQNFTVRSGEIDIIAQKSGKMYFFEVKSTRTALPNPVSRGTTPVDSAYNPVQNVTQSKIQKIHTAIHGFHMKHGHSGTYEIKVIGVWFDPTTKNARVELFDL